MIESLARAKRCFIDAAPVIYWIEEHPEFGRLVRPLMAAAAQGELEVWSSYVTLAEVLVKPLAERRWDLAEKYRDLLLETPRFHVMPIAREVAEEAASIRAEFRFRFADSLQLAAARVSRAGVFVTNDVKLKSYRGVQVVVLRDHAEPS